MSERISRDDVAKVAHLARLRLTDDELDTYTSQLGAILDHAADVEALQLDDIEPTTHPVPLRNVFRADVVTPSLDRDEVLDRAVRSARHDFADQRGAGGRAVGAVEL